MISKYFLIISIILLSSNTFPKKFKRLDPHGNKGINLMHKTLNVDSTCMICHTTKNQKGQKKKLFDYKGKKFTLSLFTLPNIIARCGTCHSKMPHSGLSEHLGEELSKLKIGLDGKIDCLSCHRPHRAKLISKQDRIAMREKAQRPFVFIKRGNLKLPKNFVERRNSAAMIRRDCIDCHTKDSLL